jgi:hypothetical protein
MKELDSDKSEARLHLDKTVEDLLLIVKQLQIFGLYIVLCSFGSAGLSVAALSIGFSGGLFGAEQYITRSSSENAFIFSFMGAGFAGLSIMMTILRDQRLRRGRVISDVLIEESERTHISSDSVDSMQVKLAIRSFQHLRGLPLTGDNSTGVFYLTLSTVSFLISIFVAALVGTF